MADYNEDEPPVSSPNELRHARFVALGGGRTLAMDMIDYRRAPILEDLVTPVHRDLVLELRGSGLKHDAIARMLGISKERMQKLFEYELEVGLEFATADVVRSLKANALAGDTTAALGLLKNHPELRWGTKSEVTGKDGEALIPENAAVVDANNAFLAAITAGFMSSDKFKRPPTKKPPNPEPVAVDKPKKLKPTGKPIRKPKGD